MDNYSRKYSLDLSSILLIGKQFQETFLIKTDECWQEKTLFTQCGIKKSIPLGYWPLKKKSLIIIQHKSTKCYKINILA